MSAGRRTLVTGVDSASQTTKVAGAMPTPAAARARGHAGNQRLHQRWLHLSARKKKPVVANVAIARELAGWCWSLAVMDD
jgi:hypothetical protein